MKHLPIGIIGVFLCVLMPSIAFAGTVLRTGESVLLDKDQSVEGDFYVAADTVSLSGVVSGDAYIAGWQVTANGNIAQDLMIVTGSAQVHASVTDDVRVISGETTIAEYVGGDVFVLGGILKILSTAHIEGNVYFYGADAEINGEVTGNIHGMSDRLRIDGPVHGSVDVKAAHSLVLGERANIAGDVNYTSRQELVRAQNAVVVGTVHRNSLSVSSSQTHVEVVVVPLLVLLFSALSMFLLFKRELQSLTDSIFVSYGRFGLIGFAGVICIPIAVVLLLASILGFLIGLVGLFAFLLFGIVSFIISGIVFGGVLSRLIAKKQELSLLWTFVGVLSMLVLAAIPAIGGLLVFILGIIVFGALLHALYKRFI